jgi:hypothetical protein
LNQPTGFHKSQYDYYDVLKDTETIIKHERHAKVGGVSNTDGRLWNCEWQYRVVGRKIFANVPYLQNDKQQDGGSTNVCLTFLLLMIKEYGLGK